MPIRSVGGRDRVIGPSREYPVPIPLSAEYYKGGIVLGDDGLLYHSDGIDWIPSTQGLQGLQGIQGRQGTQGFQGIQGTQGLQGQQGIQGIQGQQGIQGIQGIQGMQGIQGVQGRQGIQGRYGPSINVLGSVDDVTIGLPGQNESDYISSQFPGASPGDGVIDAATLNFWVWDGISWENVGQIVGPQGPEGQQGTTGLQGIGGNQGITGIQGDNGLQGIQGIEGDDGIQGITGTQGTTGGIGPTGIQGIQGITGDEGTQGTQGVQGRQGRQGRQGIRGNDGLQGTIGIQGITGVQGSEGTQGIQGTQGLQGIQGIDAIGTQGLQGLQGLQGIIGPQGVQGIQGLLGVSEGNIWTYELNGAVTITDPGSLSFSFNTTNGATASQIVYRDTPKDSGGTALDQMFNAIDSISNQVKAQVIVREKNNREVFALYEITDWTWGSGSLWGYFDVNFITGNLLSTTPGDDYTSSFIFNGQQGVQGVQGLQGLIGISTQGVQGVQGMQGIQGEFGNQGIQGIQGLQGVQGVQGIQGVDNSTQGPSGPQGIQGKEGNFGGATFYYQFDTATTLIAPDLGNVKINNADLTSGTAMIISETDSFGTNIEDFLITIDDSSSTIKGHVRISNKLDASDFVLYTISGSTDSGSYHTVDVAYVSGSATTFDLQEELIITFARTGDIGSTGLQGIQGMQGIQGIQGYQGIQGIQGAIGEVGTRTYGVTNNGSVEYLIDGISNPLIQLLRGFTYRFAVNAPGHPFYIKTAPTTGTGDQYNTGVTNNGTDAGVVQITVSDTAPATLYYQCSIHAAMGGTISTSDIGPQGVQGVQGVQGMIGISVQGVQGLQGIIGPQGITGIQGLQGTATQGVQGTATQGIQGIQGVQGVQGSGGVQGLQGNTGQQGIQGRQGITGNQGIQGGDGDATKISSVEAPASGTYYPVLVSGTGTQDATIDTSGNLSYDVGTGVLTTVSSGALFGDLAENYIADKEYETGTVLVVGGSAEVTQSTTLGEKPIAGVVSEFPSYLMNMALAGKNICKVALRGRVPVKVVGIVNKGDTLIASSIPGVAKVTTSNDVNKLQIIGVALSDKDSESEGFVEILI